MKTIIIFSMLAVACTNIKPVQHPINSQLCEKILGPWEYIGTAFLVPSDHLRMYGPDVRFQGVEQSVKDHNICEKKKSLIQQQENEISNKYPNVQFRIGDDPIECQSSTFEERCEKTLKAYEIIERENQSEK